MEQKQTMKKFDLKAALDGAQSLLDEGVRFTKEDMIDFCEYCHINAYKPEDVFDMYIGLIERESK